MLVAGNQLPPPSVDISQVEFTFQLPVAILRNCVGSGELTVSINVASVNVLQLSVARIVIVCVPAGAALLMLTTPALLTEIVPVYTPADWIEYVTVPLSPIVAGPFEVEPPKLTTVSKYVSVGAAFAVTLTCRSPVPVKLPSETWKRTVPDIAVHDAVTTAVTMPLVLVMPATVMPVAVPPAICVTANDPAVVSASATVPTVTAAPTALPCCRVIAAAGVNVGGVLSISSAPMSYSKNCGRV